MISPKKKHQQKHIWDFTDTGGFQNSTGLGGGKGGSSEWNGNVHKLLIVDENYWNYEVVVPLFDVNDGKQLFQGETFPLREHKAHKSTFAQLLESFKVFPELQKQQY